MLNTRLCWMTYVGYLCIISSTFLVAPSLADDAEPESTVRKLDPRTREFKPIDPEEGIAGKIYNHFNQQRGRYVWAIALEGGGFSYPLGPGTTESPTNFDLVTSAAQTRELVDEAAGAWAEASRRLGTEVLVRLQENNRWEVLRINSIRSHYDLDTGRRWEWHGKRKVAVSHTNGYVWRYHDQKYEPGNPWLSSTCGQCHQSHCRCGAALGHP